MKTLFRSWMVRVAALMVLASGAFAQDREPFGRQELDQMLAPVALYPDPLLTQILMASTYPLEVVQASRWTRANPGLKGRDAVAAAEPMDWDPSVKSLTAFPQVLAMMDERLEWTERLGEAFLAQPGDVMDSVQELRRRAEIAGNLRSTEQMRVAREGGYITIAPPAPEIVYVPYYDPRVVYGTWWYPAYPPVYWAPPPAYYVVPAHRPAFLWGSGIAITAGFFFGHADWHHRHVTVVHRHVNHVKVVNPHRTVWRHDPKHRRGVPFRNADARQRFEQRNAAPARPVPADFRRQRTESRPVHAGDDRRPAQREIGGIERRAQPTTRPEPRGNAVPQRPRPTLAGTRGDRDEAALPARRPATAPEARRMERPVPARPQASAPVARPANAPARPVPAAAAPTPRPAAAPVRRAETRAAPRVQANPRPAAARAAPPARAYATGNERRALVAGRPRGN